jgi:hypothetical protein
MASVLPMRALDLKRYLDGGNLGAANRKRIIERFGLEDVAGAQARVQKRAVPRPSPPPPPASFSGEGAGALAGRWQEEAMGLILSVALKP